ncbi:MAG: DUF721 domain-containing protein [Myxococcota bacterium]
MARRSSDPTQAGELVNAILRRHEGTIRGPGKMAVRVFEQFRRLGPPLTRQCEPSSYRRGCLTLRVYGAAWLMELSFLEPEIRKRLNQGLGKETVKTIRFVGGAPRHDWEAPLGPPKLDPEALARVEALGAMVPRPGVKAAVMRAAARHLGRPADPSARLKSGSGFDRGPHPFGRRKQEECSPSAEPRDKRRHLRRS